MDMNQLTKRQNANIASKKSRAKKIAQGYVYFQMPVPKNLADEIRLLVKAFVNSQVIEQNRLDEASQLKISPDMSLS